MSGHLENDDRNEPNDGVDGETRIHTENVWAQRSAAKAVASGSADNDADNASSSVIVSSNAFSLAHVIAGVRFLFF